MQFVIGFIIGAFVGFCLHALLTAGSDDDED